MSPNFQNCPRDTEEFSIRALFVPRTKDRVLLVSDFNQIEIRVSGELSQDPTMLAAYRNGLDLHTTTAMAVTGKKLAEVTKADRQKAKGINFGVLYGASWRTVRDYTKVAYGIAMTPEEAEKAVFTWRDTYKVYRQWQQERAAAAEQTCLVRTTVGKLRMLVEDRTYCSSSNTIIQGTAAEIMLIALTKIWQKFQDQDVTGLLISTIHDEVLVEADESEIYEVGRIIKESMVEAYLAVFPEGITRNLADVSVGKTWSEAKDDKNIIEL